MGLVPVTTSVTIVEVELPRNEQQFCSPSGAANARNDVWINGGLFRFWLLFIPWKAGESQLQSRVVSVRYLHIRFRRLTFAFRIDRLCEKKFDLLGTVKYRALIRPVVRNGSSFPEFPNYLILRGLDRELLWNRVSRRTTSSHSHHQRQLLSQFSRQSFLEKTASWATGRARNHNPFTD